jgi:hypothetical protein
MSVAIAVRNARSTVSGVAGVLSPSAAAHVKYPSFWVSCGWPPVMSSRWRMASLVIETAVDAKRSAMKRLKASRGIGPRGKTLALLYRGHWHP